MAFNFKVYFAIIGPFTQKDYHMVKKSDQSIYQLQPAPWMEFSSASNLEDSYSLGR